MQNAKLKITEKILELKKKRHAVILVHNYQIGEVQDIADYIGDSLGLSRAASKTNADVIVFCGVRFMAETASILCPDKIVLMPDVNAGCPMADMITRDELKAFKKEHPKATVVGYVNTSADVKAEIDICCTSGNAAKVIESLKDVVEIIFVPDKYLGHYVSTKVNRRLIFWNGYCPVHAKILPEDIARQRKTHPEAKVIVHPECTPQVIKLADEALSTSGMCAYAKLSDASEIIVGTEVGLLYRLRKENPGKKFYPLSAQAICPNMKLTTLEKALWCLEDMRYEVKVPEDIQIRAKRAVDRMLKVTP
ncbi:MAG: quinolinate synthase NadA [bacterium]